MNDDIVSQAVWGWRKKGEASASASEDIGKRRRHAAIEFCVMLAVASLLRFVFKKPTLSLFVASMATAVLVGGFCMPSLYYGIKRFGSMLAHRLGLAVTWLLLVPFFYIFFTITRIIFVMLGKDAMCRELDPSAKSYWIAHAGSPEPEQYRKQY
ncbi:MAG: hypothetical protein OSB41_14070 [Kiritimatiellae bacterium]|nr:hypothetical protein [Kiritimatiellia bacterium]